MYQKKETKVHWESIIALIFFFPLVSFFIPLTFGSNMHGIIRFILEGNFIFCLVGIFYLLAVFLLFVRRIKFRNSISLLSFLISYILSWVGFARYIPNAAINDSGLFGLSFVILFLLIPILSIIFYLPLFGALQPGAKQRKSRSNDRSMPRGVYTDIESKWWYWLQNSIFTGVVILSLFGPEPATHFYNESFFLVPLLLAIDLGFLYFGPPLRARVVNDACIQFEGPVRFQRITPLSLKRIKTVGARTWSAHLTIYNKYGWPIWYRCRQFHNSPELAQAVLDLIAKAPNAKVDEDAIKLLKQTAGGSRKALPLS